MSKVSFLDKLKILGDVTSSSGLFIIAILLLVFLGYIFLTTNKNNAKNSKKVYLIVYIAIILFVGFSYSNSIGNMFDYMMNNLFIAIYFPNLAIYLLAIIISHIILWKSMFNYKISKVIKTINISVFCIIHYILILILSIITNSKLDVFNQQSIYTNKNCLALIELSSIIFIVWILFLIIYRLFIKYITNKQDEEEEYYKEETIKDNSLINNTMPPKYIYSNMSKKIIKKDNTDIYSDLLTIDDYKLLLEILKKEKENKYKESRQFDNIEQDEQEKFRQLQDLYRSVR